MAPSPAPATPGTPSRSAADSAKIASLERALSKAEAETNEVKEQLIQCEKEVKNSKSGASDGDPHTGTATELISLQKQLEEAHQKLAAAAEANPEAPDISENSEKSAEAVEKGSEQERLLGQKAPDALTRPLCGLSLIPHSTRRC